MDPTLRLLATKPWLRFFNGESASGGSGGSGGDDGAGGGNGSGDGAGGQAGSGAGGQGKTELGFPENTPVAEMTDAQQVAYWKHKARKHESRANERGDYDQQKADAEKWRQAQRENMPADQRALEEAKDAARAEGRTEAMRTAARTILSTGLMGRGVKKDDVDERLAPVDTSYFLTDKGEVDTDKVTKFLDRNAPDQDTRAGAQAFGQGSTERIQSSGADAGRAEAQRRFADRTKK